MAQYLRDAATRRMGAALALLGAVTGLAVAKAKPDELSAQAAAGSAVPDGSLLLRDFKRGQLEKRFYTEKQVDSFLHKIEHKLTALRRADLKLLKIDDANLKFLKIDDANLKFLKIDDANLKFLKIDGAASNSAKLGGVDAGGFVQGHGSVFTGRMTIGAQESQPLFGIPGIADVRAEGRGPAVQITNLSSMSLQVIGESANAAVDQTIAPGGSFSVVFGPSPHMNVQLLPAVQADPRIVTLTASAFPSGTQGTSAVAAQALVGGP